MDEVMGQLFLLFCLLMLAVLLIAWILAERGIFKLKPKVIKPKKKNYYKTFGWWFLLALIIPLQNKTLLSVFIGALVATLVTRVFDYLQEQAEKIPSIRRQFRKD